MKITKSIKTNEIQNEEYYNELEDAYNFHLQLDKDEALQVQIESIYNTSETLAPFISFVNRINDYIIQNNAALSKSLVNRLILDIDNNDLIGEYLQVHLDNYDYKNEFNDDMTNMCNEDGNLDTEDYYVDYILNRVKAVIREDKQFIHSYLNRVIDTHNKIQRTILF